MGDFNRFLQDHASAEKKASGMAMNMISHYPDRLRMVSVMTDLAVEELTHFKEVVALLHQRGVTTTADESDVYVNHFRKAIRKGSDAYFLDRLLIGGIIEARGAERFGLVAQGLEAGKLKNFYSAITRSEQRHYEIFVDLAEEYFPQDQVSQRWGELLDIEAGICAALPFQPRLH